MDQVNGQFGLQFTLVTVDEKCDGIVRPVPCGRSWFDEDSSSLECMTCDLPNYLGHPLSPISSSSPPICKTNVLNGYESWEPAMHVPYPTYELPPDWVGSLACTDPQKQPFVCPDGLVGIKPEFDFSLGLTDWTCRCPSGDDSACQPGAVCEAGYVFENGLPRPTLCTWDDGSGTPNGLAPDGPIVYGLHDWADGFDVTIAGTERAPDVTVIVTPQALVGAITNAGLWNDDQRFTVAEDGLSASIDHCGPDALCSVLGLAAGDVVYLDSIQTDDAYLEAAATVQHADGRVSAVVVVTE